MTGPLAIIVCGGRDYTDREMVFACLDALNRNRGVRKLVHGAARGADTLAAAWAASRAVPCQAYQADWDLHRKAAGPIRNRHMLQAENPDMIVAFPGGSGTSDMVRCADAAGKPIWVPIPFELTEKTYAT